MTTSWLKNPWVYRGTLGLYVALLTGLITAYFVIAAMVVQHSAYIQGPSKLTINQPNAIRGTLMNAMTGRRFSRLHHAELRLLTKEEAQKAKKEEVFVEGIKLGTIRVEKSGLFHTTITPKDVEPGTYYLAFRAQIESASDTFEAMSSMELINEPKKAPSTWLPTITRRAEAKKSVRLGSYEHEGDVRIDVLPHKPEMVRGLPGPMYLLTTHKETGKPIPCTVNFDSVKGLVEGKSLPQRVRTNKAGIKALNFAPMVAHEWQLSASDCKLPKPETLEPEPAEPAEPVKPEPSKATVYVASVAAQSILTPSTHGANTGSLVEGYIQSLFSSGGMLFDVYQGERWLHATAFGLSPGKSGWRLPLEYLPENAAKIYRVQAYQDFFLQGSAWDTRNIILVGENTKNPHRVALQTLLERHDRDEAGKNKYFAYLLSEEGQQLRKSWSALEVRQTVRALLEAIPTHFSPPRVIINSQLDDQKALDAWRSDAKQKLMYLINLAILVGIAVLALVVLRGAQQLHQRRLMYQEIELELDDDQLGSEEEQARVARAGQLTHFVTIAQIIVVFGTVIFFGACMLMLLQLL